MARDERFEIQLMQHDMLVALNLNYDMWHPLAVTEIAENLVNGILQDDDDPLGYVSQYTLKFLQL